MTDTGITPPDFDVHTPSPARMYNFYLGGKDNFDADRQAARKAVSVVSYGRQVAWSNRRFLLRAVKYLAGRAIDQFIDLGPGIPTQPYVHDVAQAIASTARVAYVDNDPIVTSHSQALLAHHNGQVLAMHGDIRAPDHIVSDEALTRFIDFSRPVGVLFVAVLHFLTNQDDPYRTVRVFRDRIPAGSYIAISHITTEGTQPQVIATIQESYAKASAPAVFRSRSEIEALFTGLDLVEPGITEVSDWHTSHRSTRPPALRFLAGVARKH